MDAENNPIRIYVDYDSTYETDSAFRKLVDCFIVPILNNAPPNLFRRSSKKAGEVTRHATTHRALEIIYGFNYKLDSQTAITDGIFTYLWNLKHNAKALRNRLRLVKKRLVTSIEEIDKEEIVIASLACGSTRTVIETVAELRANRNFRVYAVDKNASAIEFSKSLAKSLQIDELFEWHQSSVNSFLNTANQIEFDIIEMVGFLDYRTDREAVRLFDKIYDRLNLGGFFITGNIKPNPEMKFLIDVVQWPHLIFRNEEEFAELLNRSKFANSRIEIAAEPQRIHFVSTIKKLSLE